MKKRYLPSEYSVSIIRSIEEIESIRKDWEYLQTKNKREEFNIDIDHFIAIATHLEKTISPYVVFLRYKNKPRALIIGRLDIVKLTSTIGYKIIYAPYVRCLSILLGGVLCCDEQTTCCIMVSALLNSFQKKEAEVIIFHSLPIQSEIYKFIKSSSYSFILPQYSTPHLHWQMNIPETMADFFASKSKNHRKSFRYYSNKVKKVFSNNIRIKRFINENEIGILLHDVEQVERKTYQRGLQVDLKKHQTDVVKMRIKLAAKMGWLRSYILYINNIPTAFQVGYVYKGCYFLSSTGYDPKFKKYSIGVYLFLEIIKEFCSDEHVTTWDFGRGDADYKRSFGTASREETDVRLFPSTLKGIKIFIISNMINMASIVIYKIAKQLGILNKIKRIWRDWFIKKVNQQI